MGPIGRSPGLVVAGLTLALGWPRGVPQTTVPPRPPSPTRAAAPGFPAHVVRELAALHGSTTPAAWLRAHPGDTLVRFERRLVVENDQRWCARSVQRTTLADGTPVLRYAYFYAPAPPPGLALPPAEDPQLVGEHCRLGAIWLETPATDSLAASTLAAQVRDALIQLYGPVHAAPDVWYTRAIADSSRRALLARQPGHEVQRLGLHFFGSARWRVPGRWQVDSALVASAYDKGFDPRWARVLACAVLPFSGLGASPTVREEERVAAGKTAALAAEAARLSGMEPGRVDPLFAVLAAAERAYRTAPPDSALARARALYPQVPAVLFDWIKASRALYAPHRAAALLAADQVLASAAVVFVLLQDDAGPARHALSALGAEFVHDELGKSENYAHSWLDEARRLDSVGPAGQLATLALLRLGFNETGTCGGGEDASERVSAVGEQLLRSVTDPAIAGEVHLMVADGYADVVALAAGAGANYADSAAYTAAAPDARRRAIQHYRQGIGLAPHAPDARPAWSEAWRLLAGLPPLTTYFFCVYD